MASSAFDASDAQPDVEKQLLLSDKSQIVTSFGSVEKSGIQKTPDGQNLDEEWDSTQYDMSQITSWNVFFMMKGAAFDNPGTWWAMACATMLSVGVAAFTHLSTYSLSISPATVQKMGTFLTVFVGFLLGFFLSSSMNRWFGCTNAFLQLLDAVRSMQMQMIALGVDHERCEMLTRYGILSAWLLHLSLNSPRPQAGSEEEEFRYSARERTFEWLEKARPHLVQTREKQRLLRHPESYALLWTWVASLIGRMSQDGEIPPMASPTYGRIIEIVEMAYGSIREVRTLDLVKAPFVYVHTLAVLVHVNHILNAISFGLTMGMTTKAARAHADNSLQSQLPQLLSSLFMQFCMNMVAPFLYLALLDVCVCLSQPFTYQDTKIPALQFLKALEDDVANAAVMADNTKWQKPRFKK